MPKYKKLPKVPEFDNVGKNCGNHEIQKARPLQSLAQTDLTLPEFKILDLYLSRINSHDPSKRTVRLERGELERALSVSRILKNDLTERLKHLFQAVEIKDESKPDGIKIISLFEEACAEQDKDGLWQITLTCSPQAREYIFNIENIGYLHYRLKNVINLTSRYSYVLFLYLLDNRFRKTWEIDFDELKRMLNCNSDTYKQFSRFNDLILKKAYVEINEKTDIRFDYTPIRIGHGVRSRAVRAVEFNYLSQTELSEVQLPQEDVQPTISDTTTDIATQLSTAVDNQFSPSAVEIFLDELKLKNIPEGKMPEVLRECWLRFKVEEMRKQEQGQKIENRIKYMVAIIKNFSMDKTVTTKEHPEDSTISDQRYYELQESMDEELIQLGQLGQQYNDDN